MNGDELLMSFFVLILTSALVGPTSCLSGKEQKANEAIAAGVAEYYLDSNHQRQFRWKTNLVEVKP